MKKWLMAVLVSVVCTTHAAPVRIVSLDVKSIDDIVSDALSLSQSMMIPMMEQALYPLLTPYTLTPQFAGVDRAAPLQIALYLDPEQLQGVPPALGIKIPLTDDGHDYLKALGDIAERKPDVESFRHYVLKPGSMTRESIKEIYIKPFERYIALGTTLETASDVYDALEAKSIRNRDAADATSPLNAVIDVQAAVRVFGPILEKQMETMTALMNSNPDVVAAQPFNPVDVLHVEAEALMLFLEQITSLSLALDVTTADLQVTSRIIPKAGTVFQEVVDSFQTPGRIYQSCIPEDALYAQCAHFGSFDLWLDQYILLVEKIYGAMGPSMAPVRQIMTEIKPELKGLYTGDIAVGFLKPTVEHPMRFIEVLGITDTDRARKMMDRFVDISNSMTNAQEAAFHIKRGAARMYQDVSIVPYLYDMKGLQTQMPANSAVAMWFNNMAYETAYMNGHMLITAGPSELMDTLIDRLKQGDGMSLAERKPFADLYSNLPKNTFDMGYISLLELLKSYIVLAPEATGIAGMLPPAAGTIASYSVKDGSDVVGTARIAIQDLASFSQFMMVMQMQQMQQQRAPATP